MSDSDSSRPVVLVVGRNLIGASRRCAELTLAGCQTVHVCDFAECLKLVRRHDFSLVFLLPPFDGFPLVDLPNVLREVEPFIYLPVLVELDQPSEDATCGFFRQGADGVICQQTSADELAARVRSLLRVKELHDQLSASRMALTTALDRERKLLAKLKRDNASLQELCVTDPLTHVRNVRSFNSILEHEFKNAKRYNQPLSLLMLDVDHFKLVNDMHGHPSGDYILKELAVTLTRSVRESDVVSRTGGEEFSVILPKADLRRSAVLATRIRREVSARAFAVYGRDIHITISIGAATYPTDAEITEHSLLVYLADQALLSAKESGRDRVVAFHELPSPVRFRLHRQFFDARVATAATG